ncbi:hypothetical protein ACWDXV_34210 [Nocardia nova]
MADLPPHPLAHHRQPPRPDQPRHRRPRHPVGRVWITQAFWGLTATLDRLHIDRQLEESLTHGPDPLHLTAVFGISPGTAIRYAVAARQLLTTPAELHQPS